jgi:4-hydroxybenzoate polyprenyltransferase
MPEQGDKPSPPDSWGHIASSDEIDKPTRSDLNQISSGDGVQKPLCVDLDGTLVRTDVLVEGFLSIISNGRAVSILPKLWSTSRSAFKQKVGVFSSLGPDLLPYNEEFLQFLRAQKAGGRKIILATAADAKIATAIADKLGLFDEVIASDGAQNLKGENKARELVRRFGRNGFEYAGNDRADLAVWRVADGMVLVGASPDVATKARELGKVVAEFPERKSRWSAALRAMRPHQWTKNLLVFVPLLASRQLTDIPNLVAAILAFVSLSATASSIYIFNDLMDIEADRRHPRKRKRPFASATLPILAGAFLAVGLFAAGMTFAALAGATYFVAIYAAASLCYSLVFKTYPLLDVFFLAALYTLRIVTGGDATNHPVTLWLMAFSGFTFLSLALVKRVGELGVAGKTEVGTLNARRGYVAEDRPVLMAFGVASATASAVVLALFIGTSAAFQPYRSPEILWCLIPLILFWQMRLWLATNRGHMHDDPIVYASRDWVSWLVAFGVITTVLLASVAPSLW